MRGPDRAAAIAESNNHTGRRMQPIVSEIASWNPKVEALGRPRLDAWLGQAPHGCEILTKDQQNPHPNYNQSSPPHLILQSRTFS